MAACLEAGASQYAACAAVSSLGGETRRRDRPGTAQPSLSRIYCGERLLNKYETASSITAIACMPAGARALPPTESRAPPSWPHVPLGPYLRRPAAPPRPSDPPVSQTRPAAPHRPCLLRLSPPRQAPGSRRRLLSLNRIRQPPPPSRGAAARHAALRAAAGIPASEPVPEARSLCLWHRRRGALDARGAGRE